MVRIINALEQFRAISLSHKTLSVEEVGLFHIPDELLAERVRELLLISGLEEVMFLSTCNRVEFLLSSTKVPDKSFLDKFLTVAYPEKNNEDVQRAIDHAQVFSGDPAVHHLFKVVSSLDSLVVGEREIITQVRNAYETSRKMEGTGDLIRLVIKKTIEAGKEVYTQTNIARNPVSVVSLAYRKLRDLNVKLNSRFILIGAGVTNATYGKFLRKHGYTNFVVFNRTISNAERLAGELDAISLPLSELENYSDGFDVIVTCTGSAEPIITPEIYKHLLAGDTKKKIVVDLAVPGDLDPAVLKEHDIHHICVSSLKDVAENNLREREKEMGHCMEIVEKNLTEFKQEFRTRQVELAMSEVPKKVREIRDVAMNEVFAKDLLNMDEDSRKVLSKVIDYLEKKYISVPMKMAKEILLEETSQK